MTRVRVRVRDRVRISLRLTLILILTLTLTLTLNNDYTTLLISRLYCNIDRPKRSELSIFQFSIVRSF